MQTLACTCGKFYVFFPFGHGAKRDVNIVDGEGLRRTKCPDCDRDLKKLWWKHELETWSAFQTEQPAPKLEGVMYDFTNPTQQSKMERG